ncbi:MAG: helix-hairpin-helix domain-containing protein [Peptococcaceae bacterium]|nr:helix-hairpin-helix domain-containing protein [Peptococcaceae bacterium]
MIVRITGVYVGSSPKGILLEAGAITYDISLTSYTRSSFLQSHQPGAQVSLYTIYYIESNLAGGHLTPTMLGFTSEEEREFFQLFTSVAKIGVKTALTASAIPVSAIAEAIENDDAHTLKKLRGIGERTAHKIIASLKGKVTGFLALPGERTGTETVQTEVGTDNEALQVLLQLGHNMNEAKKMIKDAISNISSGYTTEELLEEIYRNKN